MVYDDVLHITWLKDWNYAQTSGHDSDGRMSWADANTWANNLVYGGFDDWRLPSSLNTDGSGPCSGLFCMGSEMGLMYYTNWSSPPYSYPAPPPPRHPPGLLSNTQSMGYWSGTEYPSNPDFAWSFATGSGAQISGIRSQELLAVAVRNGDVAPVPEPRAYAMALAGLFGIMVMARRRPR